jgi:hypothetical protein
LYLSEAKLKSYLFSQVNIPAKPVNGRCLEQIFDTVKIQSNARKIQFYLAHMRVCNSATVQSPFVTAMKEVQNTEKKDFGKHATFIRR